MITISDLALQYSGTFLFQHVDLQFTAGNCYGVIGANGAGKSTFLKLLSGELDSTKGTISIKPGLRMSVLKQDQFRYDAYTIMDTVIMGNQRLYDIMKQKDALYAKPDFSDEDGLLASELETEFAELNGWEAESDASRILQGLGVPVELAEAGCRINELPQVKTQSIKRFLFGSAYEISADKQGRVSVPQPLREYATLTADVVVVGLEGTAEIWDKASWVKFNENTNNEDLTELALELGI